MYVMEQIAEIAARIRELREACGYTQEELAKELGIDVAVLRAYEENGYNIPISVIYQIANLCGVDFTEILTGNDPRLDTYQIVKRAKAFPLSESRATISRIWLSVLLIKSCNPFGFG